jgi:hypothetical protein
MISHLRAGYAQIVFASEKFRNDSGYLIAVLCHMVSMRTLKKAL